VTTSIHLQPTSRLAERVLLPGDPGRALFLAQELLEAPKMFNHYRGLWGYTGLAPDGGLLTVQSTGMGGPSAAIVVSELADLGARSLLRVGTCGAIEQDLALGDLVIATESIAADGTSRALTPGVALAADPELLDALLGGRGPATHAGPVVSTDLFYDERARRDVQWREAGAIAVDMETATLFALAAQRGLQAASVLIVAELAQGARRRISQQALREAEHRLGLLAVQALTEAVAPRGDGR
jgi:DeoD family purine-nucleoside phosphorylase